MALSLLPKTNFSSPFASMTGNHVAVRVPDLDEARRWWVEKLDFRFVHEWTFGDQLAYVAPPTDDTFFVELIGGGTPIPERPYLDLENSLELAGYHHLCFMVESVDRLSTKLRGAV
jgi:Lactoylglutathione lyase and related lyases